MTEQLDDSDGPEPVVDGLRQCVAESISAVDPIDSTWQDCLRMADAALATLQPVFEAKDAEIQRLRTELDAS